MLNDKNKISWLNGQEIISKDIELKATKVT